VNQYELVVKLPKSDGFHTHDDLHLATTVKRLLEETLSSPASVSGCTIEYRRITKETP
jgi:hypothetical protein